MPLAKFLYPLYLLCSMFTMLFREAAFRVSQMSLVLSMPGMSSFGQSTWSYIVGILVQSSGALKNYKGGFEIHRH